VESVLEALIALAQVQLTEAWAEVRDQNSYALALAALGIAVIGIIAAVQAQLGGDWWVPIPGLAVTSIVALLGTRRRPRPPGSAQRRLRRQDHRRHLERRAGLRLSAGGRVVGWLLSIAVDRVVAQLAQFGQRLVIRRTVGDFLRADDVLERRGEDGPLSDLQQDGVFAKLLVAGEVPAAVAGNAHQNIQIAGAGAPGAEFHAMQKRTVDRELLSLRRPVGNL